MVSWLLTWSYKHNWCWIFRLPKFSNCPGKHQKTPQICLADSKLKLHEIAVELKISEGSVFAILHEHSSMKKLCTKWVQCLLTVNQKRVDSSEYCFCINMWQWMKHGSTTSLQSQISSQLSEQQQVKAVQSDKRHKHQQFWPLDFGMPKVLCSYITIY